MGGRDYAAREFTLTVDSRLDCDVSLARDASMIHGQVSSSDKPAPGVLVMMTPTAEELRKVPASLSHPVPDPALCGDMNADPIIQCKKLGWHKM
jgi:hypothetical protein